MTRTCTLQRRGPVNTTNKTSAQCIWAAQRKRFLPCGAWGPPLPVAPSSITPAHEAMQNLHRSHALNVGMHCMSNEMTQARSRRHSHSPLPRSAGPGWPVTWQRKPSTQRPHTQGRALGYTVTVTGTALSSQKHETGTHMLRNNVMRKPDMLHKTIRDQTPPPCLCPLHASAGVGCQAQTQRSPTQRTVPLVTRAGSHNANTLLAHAIWWVTSS